MDVPKFGLIACIWTTAISVLCADEDKYCGLYGIYGAAKALGVENADFESLIVDSFISTTRGSTADDLIGAAAKLGIRTIHCRNATIASLHAAQTPLLLHISSNVQYREFNHWQLFLGWEQNKLRMVDHNGKIYLEHPSSLIAKWDGEMLIAVKNQEGLWKLHLFGAEVVYIGSIAALVCFLLYLASRYGGRLVHSRGYRGLILVGVPTAVVSSILCLLPVTSQETRDVVLRTFRNYTPGSIELGDLDEIVGGKALLVDARKTAAFQNGHIPGATNLPVDVSDAAIRELRKHYSADQAIIVYCQSAACEWDKAVAQRLYANGFQNVKVAREGFAEWKALKKQDQ